MIIKLIVLILAQCALANAGMYTLKVACKGLAVGSQGQLLTLMTRPLLWAGIVLYGISFVLLIVVISRGGMSFIVPFSMAVNFVLATLIGMYALGETVPPLGFAGVGCVLLGVVLMALGQRGLHG